MWCVLPPAFPLITTTTNKPPLGNRLVVCSYWPRGNIGSKTENLFIKNVGVFGGPKKNPDPANNPPVPKYSGPNVQIPPGLLSDGGGEDPSLTTPSPSAVPPPPQPNPNVKTVTITVNAKRDQPTLAPTPTEETLDKREGEAQPSVHTERAT